MKKIVQDLLARLLAGWALISFLITFLIVLIPSLLCAWVPNPRGQALFIRIARVWMLIWLRMVGCPPHVSGKHHFKKGQSYVVVCNHNSLMDPPMTSPFIPGPNKTIAKASFAKVPLFGWYYRMGAILVDRKSELSRRRSYEQMRAVLELGMHMCVYPEGTRNRTEEPLKSFYDGAFKLAVETEKPVLPALLFYTRDILPPNRGFYFRPHRIVLEFMEPVPSHGETVQSLKEKIFQLMWDRYQQGPSRNS